MRSCKLMLKISLSAEGMEKILALDMLARSWRDTEMELSNKKLGI